MQYLQIIVNTYFLNIGKIFMYIAKSRIWGLAFNIYDIPQCLD